jgi:hypothetical protein
VAGYEGQASAAARPGISSISQCDWAETTSRSSRANTASTDLPSRAAHRSSATISSRGNHIGSRSPDNDSPIDISALFRVADIENGSGVPAAIRKLEHADNEMGHGMERSMCIRRSTVGGIRFDRRSGVDAYFDWLRCTLGPPSLARAKRAGHEQPGGIEDREVRRASWPSSAQRPWCKLCGRSRAPKAERRGATVAAEELQSHDWRTATAVTPSRCR